MQWWSAGKNLSPLQGLCQFTDWKQAWRIQRKNKKENMNVQNESFLCFGLVKSSDKLISPNIITADRWSFETWYTKMFYDLFKPAKRVLL